MADVPYQRMFDIIAPSLPLEWAKVVLYAAFQEDVCEVKYYVQDDRGQYSDCFQLHHDQDEILLILVQLTRMISEARAQLEVDDRWTTMTFCVESDGGFRADYEHSGPSDDRSAVHADWKRRYLVP